VKGVNAKRSLLGCAQSKPHLHFSRGYAVNLNDLLLKEGIDPHTVLVFRHRPSEPKLNKVLPWLVVEKPDVFNAYQQTHNAKVEKAMLGAKYVASFIRHDAGKALFVGLYKIGPNPRPFRIKEYWAFPQYKYMHDEYDMKGLAIGPGRSSALWFDLVRQKFHEDWIGKLIVRWPPPERSWWRRAHKNDMTVEAILHESILESGMPEWSDLSLSWAELAVLPRTWRTALSHWRGIYYIFDTHAGKGYVGSAYGADNILGRWLKYAASGHGGNALLRRCDPSNFKFSILQRVSPDMSPEEVIRLESTWKVRLSTRKPHGLNVN
jgi:hypothetical protein